MVNKLPELVEDSGVHVPAADDRDHRTVDADRALESRRDGCGAGWFRSDPGDIREPEDGARRSGRRPP